MAGLAAMVVMGAIAMIAGLVAAKREKRGSHLKDRLPRVAERGNEWTGR